MKKGITATSAAIMIVIIVILLGTVSIASYNSIQNAKKMVFAIEIAEIQEEVTKYYKDSVDNMYPTTEATYTINLSQVTTDALTQFDSETKSGNNEVTLYEVDLTAIGITDTTYGNLEGEKDIYVVSKDTGIVYYLEGIKAGAKTYYTITQDLIDIKERNSKDKEEASLATLPVISSDGIVQKTLSDGTSEKYIANIKVTGDEVEIIKYEIGIIEEENAKSYFETSGTTLNSDRIRIKDKTPITLYAENSAGDFVIKYAGYPYIPEDFIASDISTEDEVNEGLVIYEGKDIVSQDTDAETTRDQYVWVPVPDMSEFVLRIGYMSGAEQTNYPMRNVSEPLDKTTSDGITLSATNDLTEEYAEHKKMKASVEKYGGFYIARYEAGTTTARKVSVSNGTSFKADGTTPDVLSRKGKEPYNYVGWGPTMTSVSGDVKDATSDGLNQGYGAVQLSRGIYPEDEAYDIVSTLIYDVQWDATMNFMKDIYNPNVEGKKYIEDSTGMGRYGGVVIQATGKDIDAQASNKVKNIYDMGGNVLEFTMGAYLNNYRIMRGGYAHNSAYEYPASVRSIRAPEGALGGVGFRVALYIK